ncbi:MAG: hypothetical protein GX175_03295 [Halanaerobiaceae bacterium]|nr:hypothetical protein [Halanaerobiaceae bacterium]
MTKMEEERRLLEKEPLFQSLSSHDAVGGYVWCTSNIVSVFLYDRCFSIY